MTTINNKLVNLAICGCSIWLFFLRPLLSDPYEHVHDEVSGNVTSFGIKRGCNWLELDKVSLKLIFKELGER